MTMLRVRPSHGLRGQIAAPGDKSISHRAALLGAIAEGDTRISGYLVAEDTLNTARALVSLGVSIEGLGEADMVVHGVGLRGLQQPSGVLDLGNSGTGMRLLMGILAGQSFTATLVGDASLSRRPMDRIAQPLHEMGVHVSGQGERCMPPVTVHGGTPRPTTYHSPVASAQVKSAVLLAGLYADGTTSVVEPALSRDHTERMLQAFGADCTPKSQPPSGSAGSVSWVTGGRTLRGRQVTVPGDFSSAAFALAAGVLCPESSLTLPGVLLNPTRTGLLEALLQMGAAVTVTNQRDQAGETVGDLHVQPGPLQATIVGGAQIPCLIDEVPILAVVATQAEGATEIRDAAELRVKESDRLALMADGLRAMGAEVRELTDGLVITGPTPLHGATLDAAQDHRIAMSFAVAGLIAKGETLITGAEAVDTSFPGFVSALRSLGADVETA